ncbi:MAG: BTAD domain-containing putative transcriptional regulator [Nocardioidaceae bacterium]
MIEISLFGAVAVQVDGVATPHLSAKQRHVLAILALAEGAPVSRERLADQLWEGAPPVSYVSTLDSYVCLLRRSLGLAAGRRSRLATADGGFRLDVGAEIEVDVASFRALARVPEEATSRDVVARAEQALQLLRRGELLADVPYAEWGRHAREDLRRSAVDLFLAGAQRANALGMSDRAVALARAATDRDPVCEDAWRQLMLAHWFSGRRAAALSVYAELRGALLDHLGEEPGSESRQLYLTVLRETSEQAPQQTDDSGSELRTLLRLLRQTLEGIPGVRTPARDAALSEVAVLALASA